MIDVSFIIITRNRKNELIKAIESCFNVTNCASEIIIVDNGSTDGTEELVKKLKMPHNFEINFFKAKENLGVSGGRNQGVKIARGEYLFFLDDDAYFTDSNGSFDKLIEYFEVNKDVAISGVNIYDDVHQEYQNNRFGLPTFLENKRTFRYIGAGHLFRKSTIGREHLYPPKLMYGAEETYAAILARANGYEVIFCPTVKIIHHPSKKTRDNDEVNQENIMINLYVIKRLLFPRVVGFISWILFSLRILRLKNYALSETVRCIRLARERIKQNQSVRTDIGYKILLSIAKEYGIMNLI